MARGSPVGRVRTHVPQRLQNRPGPLATERNVVQPFQWKATRVVSVEGDEKRYAHLESPIGDSLFAAYDPQEKKLGKSSVVASSDYLYTPRSLFWPDLIFLTAHKLDWVQAVGMAINVQKRVNVDPELLIIAGSNDHLQSRGLLNALNDRSTSSSRNQYGNVLRSNWSRLSSCCLLAMPRYPNACNLCTPWSSCWRRDNLM